MVSVALLGVTNWEKTDECLVLVDGPCCSCFFSCFVPPTLVFLLDILAFQPCFLVVLVMVGSVVLFLLV